MNKQDVISFFDRHAAHWDAELVRSDEIIGTILDNAEVLAGARVLDVACGTGVLFPDYLARKVADVTAVDISPEMVKIAASKYPDAPIRVLCGDAECLPGQEQYDCIVIYNAFPHFPDPERLIAALCAHLKDGGTLTVAHGMSRRALDRHHEGAASRVSVGLMHEDALAALFEKYLTVTVKISDEAMYQVVGKKDAQRSAF